MEQSYVLFATNRVLFAICDSKNQTISVHKMATSAEHFCSSYACDRKLMTGTKIT